MSVMVSEDVACPSCGENVGFEVCFSVNGGRHAHLRQGILDGTFQRQTCAACGAAFRLDPEFTYFDAGRAQWLLVRPAADSASWQELENTALEIFDTAFGKGTPKPVQALAEAIRPRVVFGWPALREKLVCKDLGLDDVTLELTKLLLLRSMDESPIGDDVELRLVGIKDDMLQLAWVRTDETLLERVRAPRALYDDVATSADAWAALHNQLDAGPFVDVDRLWVDPQTEA